MNPSIKKIIEHDNIPSPPTVAARLVDLVGRPDSSIVEITKVLSADPKLSAKLIDYCNSPMVATNREISSLQQAVTLLGLRTLRLLSLSFSLMDTKGNSGFPYESFWRNSLGMAIASKLLARHLRRSPDECFLLGLVFNIGLIGIGNNFEEELAERFEGEDLFHSITPDQERDIANASRYEIGAALLSHWNFPEEMVTVLDEYDPCNLSATAEMYYVAQKIGSLLLSEKADERQIRDARKTAEALLEIEEENFNNLFNSMVDEWKGYETLFDFETIAIESISDLEMQAKESMMQISLGMERTITQMTEEQEELRALAMVDSLTRLKNRSAYDAEVQGILDLHRRHKRSFGMIIADIDHFKTFNDEYGHAAGDCVLRAVAECLDANSRQYDTVYRFGGEEFAVVVTDCEFDSTANVAERLRAAVEELKVEYDGQPLNVTASFGVCWVGEGKLEKIENLFNEADANLYEAKRAGRNRCVAGRATAVALAI